MRLDARTSLGLLLIACGGTQPSAATTPDEPDTEDALHALNAEAREGAVTETLHGVEVADPYRALETESPLTTRWIEAQSARTEEALPEDEGRRARVEALLQIGALGGVRVGGERVFYELREGEREQPALMVRIGDAEHLLIDPTSFGERAALDWYYPSPDGARVAFGISNNGDEKSTLHVLDVDARVADPEGGVDPLRIPRTKWCNLSWLPDASGFYYTRYPNPGEEGYDAEQEDHYFPRVFFHALGSDPIDDPRIFGSEQGTDFPIPDVSDDGSHVVINLFRGWSKSDVYFFARGDDHDDVEMKTIIEGADAITYAQVYGRSVYATTNLDAPRSRVVTIPLARATEREAWVELIAEREAKLEEMVLAGDGIAAHYIEGVRSRVLLFDREGNERGEVELPTRGSVDHLEGEPGAPVVFGFSGYLQPPSVLSADVATGDSEELRRVEADFDFSPFTVTQEHVASADGTEVPVYLVHRRDLERSSDNPVLVYGYGGFNISIMPSFSRRALYWLEQGGVYAVANLRGGGELGEQWHRAGMLGEKERVFEDFEAVIRWLGGASGISTPRRIGIMGGSNGGLLMGAMITRIPGDFGAAASYVGLYDMVRYHEFPPAELWISEYGSAEDPEQFGWLHAYSPYHRVRAGTAYPAVLIETADHDSRVHWAHSTKFAAALQEATSSDEPIYFYMRRAMGHGAGSRLSDLVDQYERMYGFLERELGVE